MRAHYIQHVAFEGLGSIEAWLQNAGYEITRSQLFALPDFPGLDDIDLLIVMGGPMSVNDEVEFPWLVPEKTFIREFIASGRPVLGICLGAQLIANALGARVYRNSVKEIGWFPIQAVATEETNAFPFPPSMEVFHWHGETFDLPPGATRLARSAACENQAFQIGRSVIGLQFHLETTSESARQIVDNCRGELVASQYVQTEETILSAGPDRYRAINRRMSDLLSFLQQGNISQDMKE